jgi:membrane protease YdiL (CAAX protease family)
VSILLLRPVLAVLAAIGITATMDASGLANLSALPLFPLLVLFWAWGRESRASAGFAWGSPRGYLLAALWPLLVVGALVLVALAAGAVDVSHTSWGRALRNLALTVIVTFVLAILTEEGFFRGWLWASLSRAGLPPSAVLLLTSIAFALWHVSTVTLDTAFSLPPAQIAVYLGVAVVVGVILGLLRSLSGSVVVASMGHGLWNGISYVLFGVGTHAGALGITNSAMLGPESGILGLAANVIFAAGLWLLGSPLRANPTLTAVKS